MGLLSPVMREVWGRPQFALDAYLSSLSDSAWWDFTRPDTMFQESAGPTPADGPNEPIGLVLSRRQWGRQTRDGFLAGQPENRQNGAPVLAGTATAATYNTSTGEGTVTRVDFTHQSGVALTGLSAGRTYALDITGQAGMFVRDGSTGLGAVLATLTGASRVTCYVTPGVGGAVTITATAAGGTQSFTLHSLKEVSRYAATQATASFKPKYQTAGAAFDGADDNLLTGYTAGSGANTLIAKVVVPASVAAVQIFFGARASVDTRTFIGVDTSGRMIGGVGSQSGAVINDGTSRLGQTIPVALSYDATTVRLFSVNALVYEGARVGTPDATVAFRIGALNDNGTANGFFGGSVQHAIAYQGGGLLDLARFIQIANALGG